RQYGAEHHPGNAEPQGQRGERRTAEPGGGPGQPAPVVEERVRQRQRQDQGDDRHREHLHGRRPPEYGAVHRPPFSQRGYRRCLLFLCRLCFVLCFASTPPPTTGSESGSETEMPLKVTAPVARCMSKSEEDGVSCSV